MPFQLECAAETPFSMLMRGLRLGHSCRGCARDRTKHSLDRAHTAEIELSGQCLFARYANNRQRFRWRCEAGHAWSASLDNVSRGDSWIT